MHRTQGHRCKAKYLKRKRGYMSSIKGVSHLSRRAKRRLYCKLQLWMWRRRREKCHFGIFRAKRRACGFSPSSCLSVKTPSQKSKSKVVSHSGCNAGSLGEQNRPLKLCGTITLPQTLNASSSSQNLVTDTTVSAGSVTVPTASVASRKTETLAELGEITDPLNHSHRVKPVQRRAECSDGSTTRFNETGTAVPAQRLDVDGPSGQLAAVPAGQDQAANGDADGRIASETDASLKVLTEDIHEFLEDFYRIYGSFIPLQKSDVLRHLKRRFNTDFRDRTNDIFPEVTKHRSAIIQKPVPSFRVVYKKHTLTLDDLSTLADQNWLNDQVMNMYGELIMESTHHKVHFLNSFFHRQLMTKGYDGVKRWTKQVDLFSKSLLLVPVHLEVHWCLVSADIVKKKICLYDSQGNALQKVARNILKYLMAEAREKKQTAFENGWAMSFDENIPQQTNENDCGVFVLEYSRCLALGQPLQFSQKDIPKIRTRIYKELCDCKLHEEG